MLIGRTKHILYIKIQTSSDNNRISKKKKKKKEHKYSCDVLWRFLLFSMFTQLKTVYIVIKMIVHYNYQCQLLAHWLL